MLGKRAGLSCCLGPRRKKQQSQRKHLQIETWLQTRWRHLEKWAGSPEWRGPGTLLWLERLWKERGGCTQSLCEWDQNSHVYRGRLLERRCVWGKLVECVFSTQLYSVCIVNKCSHFSWKTWLSWFIFCSVVFSREMGKEVCLQKKSPAVREMINSNDRQGQQRVLSTVSSSASHPAQWGQPWLAQVMSCLMEGTSNLPWLWFFRGSWKSRFLCETFSIFFQLYWGTIDS